MQSTPILRELYMRCNGISKIYTDGLEMDFDESSGGGPALFGRKTGVSLTSLAYGPSRKHCRVVEKAHLGDRWIKMYSIDYLVTGLIGEKTRFRPLSRKLKAHLERNRGLYLHAMTTRVALSVLAVVERDGGGWC